MAASRAASLGNLHDVLRHDPDRARAAVRQTVAAWTPGVRRRMGDAGLANARHGVADGRAGPSPREIDRRSNK